VLADGLRPPWFRRTLLEADAVRQPASVRRGRCLAPVLPPRPPGAVLGWGDFRIPRIPLPPLPPLPHLDEEDWRGRRFRAPQRQQHGAEPLSECRRHTPQQCSVCQVQARSVDDHGVWRNPDFLYTRYRGRLSPGIGDKQRMHCPSQAAPSYWGKYPFYEAEGEGPPPPPLSRSAARFQIGSLSRLPGGHSTAPLSPFYGGGKIS